MHACPLGGQKAPGHGHCGPGAGSCCAEYMAAADKGGEFAHAVPPIGSDEAGASICKVMPGGRPLPVAGCNCSALQPSPCMSAMPTGSAGQH